MFFATPAYAQTASTQAPGAPGGGQQEMLVQFAPIILMFVLGYFLLLRPQQRRARQHQEAIKAVKRGDTVVLSSGVIGKIARVDDTEVQLEIAPNVSIKVVKAMISDVRTRPEPANDAKP